MRKRWIEAEYSPTLGRGSVVTDEFWLALAPAAAEDGPLIQFRKDYTDTMPTIVGFLASTARRET